MLYNHRMRKYLLLLAIMFLTVSCSTASLSDTMSNVWSKISPFSKDDDESKRLDALETEIEGKGRTLIASGHPDYPPVMWREGDYIAGVGTDILKLAFEGRDITVDSKFRGSWREVLENAKEGGIDAIVGMYITEERRRAFEFSVPYMKDPVVIFVAKDKVFPFKKWDDLKGKRGTSVVGDGYGQEFDRFIARNLTVTRALKAEDSFKKLLSGDADYFICAMYSGLLEAQKLDISDKIEYLPTYAVAESLYIAVSKKSKYLKYLPEINKRIEALTKDGAIDKLIDEKRASYMEAVKTKGGK
jgi:polar amino acid transport system substrate-binding protein